MLILFHKGSEIVDIIAVYTGVTVVIQGEMALCETILKQM